MYEAIYNFAVKKQLVPVEHFTPKLISGYIVLDENSNFLGIEIKDKSDKEKTLCPDIGTLAFGKANCNPLVENVLYVFDKKQAKHQGFVDIMESGSKFDKNFEIIYDFIQKYDADKDLEDTVKEEIKSKKLKDKQIISFKINDLKVEESEGWKTWFINYMKSKQPQVLNVEKTISSVTGKEVIPLTDKSPIVKNPSSVLGTGAYIVSNANSAFSSYGLMDNRNSPIGVEEANIIKEGLEYLLSNKNHFNRDFSVIHFCENEENEIIFNSIFDMMPDFYNEEIETIETKMEENKDLILENTLSSLTKGKNVDTSIENDVFHMMRFELPTKGRFYLSHYIKGSCQELQRNILQWKNDTRIEYCIYNKDDKVWNVCKSQIDNVHSIFYHLLNSKDVRDKFEQIKKEFGEDKINLLYAIINNNQMPIKIFQRAVSLTTKDMIAEQKIDRICIQIIKAYLNRNNRKKGEPEFMESLNEEEKSVSYNCGRLFAVYETIQFNAQGNLNSSVTDSFFASAQRTPSLVFGRLATLSNYHLKKLEEPKKIYWSKKIQEISEKIPNFPKTFNVEEQGAFALGYYHQKNAIFKSKKNDENKGENYDEK